MRVLFLSLFFIVAAVSAAPAPQSTFTGPDYSGTYDCKGNDLHEGKYTGVVTLKLVREQSAVQYGAYNFELEVPGFGTYPGQAAAKGNMMAIHFALTDPSAKDYGTGIAQFNKIKSGKWEFSKYYYEPEFKGGNYGFETCRQR